MNHNLGVTPWFTSLRLTQFRAYKMNFISDFQIAHKIVSRIVYRSWQLIWLLFFHPRKSHTKSLFDKELSLFTFYLSLAQSYESNQLHLMKALTNQEISALKKENFLCLLNSTDSFHLLLYPFKKSKEHQRWTKTNKISLNFHTSFDSQLFVSLQKTSLQVLSWQNLFQNQKGKPRFLSKNEKLKREKLR